MKHMHLHCKVNSFGCPAMIVQHPPHRHPPHQTSTTPNIHHTVCELKHPTHQTSTTPDQTWMLMSFLHILVWWMSGVVDVVQSTAMQYVWRQHKYKSTQKCSSPISISFFYNTNPCYLIAIELIPLHCNALPLCFPEEFSQVQSQRKPQGVRIWPRY